MFHKIVLPVDLTHADKLGKALGLAAELATRYGAEVCYVGVTANTPGAVARNPKDYSDRLAAFAAEQGHERGINTTSRTIVSHDPSVDTDRHLIEAVKDLGADLVVMATHLPNAGDYIWAGHGASVAAHVGASVFLVRD
ncbi:universal stress protein [Sagittula salina]|uniref:Universal stress protein n=1 Tax=Sagittula salina TaxID=2820268 RepID=A0A940S0H4_9RHOB|nr:universal stress protein [Sagittula salina]MBP0483078.1 universal stress protein [Sagittula salina]